MNEARFRARPSAPARTLRYVFGMARRDSLAYAAALLDRVGWLARVYHEPIDVFPTLMMGCIFGAQLGLFSLVDDPA
jgi:hypothetical protein